jgi:cold shock CspA family protein
MATNRPNMKRHENSSYPARGSSTSSQSTKSGMLNVIGIIRMQTDSENFGELDSPQKHSMTRPPIMTSRPSSSSTTAKPASSAPSSAISRPPIIRPVMGRSSADPSASTSASPSTSRATGRPMPLDYGIIVTIKETFGFIQGFQEEEQMYFSEREFYPGIAVGQEVSFIKRPKGSKGFHVERLTSLQGGSKEYIYNLTAVVVREADSLSHRGTPGLIELSEESRSQVLTNPKISPIIQAYGPLPAIPFFLDDIQLPNNGKAAKKIFKGDEVACSLGFIAGTAYLRATSINFVRGKRDRLLQDQIQKMLEAGVKREQGIIDAIKNEEYGFIRPVERAEQIYFRMDDAVEENTKFEANMEVEFFVIAESVKGKLCDRAVHLQVLPAGSVQFEVTVAKDVQGYVSKESLQGPHEQPGRIKLVEAVSYASESLTSIELWQRCLPSDLILQVGDRLRFDIQHYRPENLYFARSVQVLSYQTLSREYGSICSIKEYGFGFIRSHIRDLDLYFRTAEVRDGDTGELIAEDTLQLDMVVSFNVLIDDATSFKGINTSSSVKLKAIRMTTISKEDQQRGVPATVDELRLSLLASQLRGITLKDAINKRDSQPGQIQLSSDAMTQLQQKQQKAYHAIELEIALRDFLANPMLTDVTIKYLAPGQRKAYHDLMDDLFADSITHESIDLPKDAQHVSDPAKGRALLITKKTAGSAATSSAGGEKTAKESSSQPKLMVKGQVNGGADDGIAFYMKQDVDEVYGPLAKDLEVSFDLYVDKRTMKRVAKNVRLTDDPILDNDSSSSGGVAYGVIDSIVGVRSGRFGFIRRITNDEKLFWHSTSIVASADGSSNIDYDALHERQELSFDLRRRGGMRCAANIRLLPINSLVKEESLDGAAIAMVIDALTAVLIDAQDCKDYAKKLWDTRRLAVDCADPLALAPSAMTEDEQQQIKYYPAIPRLPVELIQASSAASPPLSVGSTICCQLRRKAALSRQPSALVVDSILSDADYPIVKKLSGIISRIKIKPETLLGELLSNSSSSSANAASASGIAIMSSDPWHGLEFCEIQCSAIASEAEATSSAAASSRSSAPTSYYCLYSEIQASKADVSAVMMSQGQDKAKIGDKVDFYPMTKHRVALYPMLIPAVSFYSRCSASR